MWIILINSHAGWVQRQSLSNLVSSCESILAGGGRVIVTDTLESLETALAGLDASRITALVPVGGDGTMSAVLSAALRRWSPETLPAFLPLSAGTMNMVSLSLRHRRESPLSTLNRAVQTRRTGETLKFSAHTFITTHTGHAGFVTGFGMPTRFLAHYYESGAGPLKAVTSVLKHSASTFVNGPLARELFAPVETTCTIDDEPPVTRPMSVLMAITVQRLPLGFRLGPRQSGGMSLLYGQPNPLWLVASLPLMNRGLVPEGINMQRRHGHQVELAFAEPQGWQMDGDIHPPTGRLAFHAHHQVQLIV